MVYLLRNTATSHIKIGYSKDPRERLRTLQTGSAGKLALEYVIENVDMSFEQFMHEICQRYRISGEWFQGNVIEDHLLKHPWYAEHLKPYRTWLKEKRNATDQSDNDSASIES